MKKHILTLQIPNPCRENWEQMTPSGQGRHCANCDKVVVDMSRWSDEKMYRFFSEQKQKVCARFDPEQIGRGIAAPEPTKKMPYKAAAALGFAMLSVLSGRDCAMARPPMTHQIVTVNGDDDEGGSNNASMICYVVKGQEEAMAHLQVTINQIGRIVATTQTDIYGKFSFEGLSAGKYIITVTYRQGKVDSFEVILKEGMVYNDVFHIGMPQINDEYPDDYFKTMPMGDVGLLFTPNDTSRFKKLTPKYGVPNNTC